MTARNSHVFIYILHNLHVRFSAAYPFPSNYINVWLLSSIVLIIRGLNIYIAIDGTDLKIN